MLRHLQSMFEAAKRGGGVDPGVTILSLDRWTLAEELWSFGEDALYRVPLELPDEELVRVWVVAGRLFERDEARSVGEAAALAAVSVIEGRRRPLARTRRRPQAKRPHFEQTREERLADVHRIEASDAFPEIWR